MLSALLPVLLQLAPEVLALAPRIVQHLQNGRIDEALTDGYPTAGKIAELFDGKLPPLETLQTVVARFRPVVETLIAGISHGLKEGLSDGSIVPDGKGGYVPSTNSHYDPTTGRFIPRDE